MKKPFVIGVFTLLFIVIIVLVSTNLMYKKKIDKQKFIFCTFRGEDANIRISDGVIIVSPNKHTISGGKIQYIGNKYENIQGYSETIYLDNQGYKNILLSNSVSVAGDKAAITFPDEFLLNKNIGEVSSETLLSENDINIIEDNLYFSLNYSTVDGQTGNFTVKLKVMKYNMAKTK